MIGNAPLLAVVVVLYAAGPRLPVGVELYRPTPENNRLTAAKISLGRRLFFDRRLSRDGSLSCAGCHDAKRALTDGRIVAQGVAGALGNRNTPIIVNRAWGERFFFDGRAATLEDLALQPILNPKELGMTADAVLSLMRSSYRSRFRTAFGSEPSLELTAKAIASYLRTIVDGDSPFDHYAAGDASALSESPGAASCCSRRKPVAASVIPARTSPTSSYTTQAWLGGLACLPMKDTEAARSRRRPSARSLEPRRTCTTGASRLLNK